MSRTGPALCWVGGNTLAVLTGELGVRCWDLQTGDTYVLYPPESSTDDMATPQEICTSLSYCKNNGTKFIYQSYFTRTFSAKSEIQ